MAEDSIRMAPTASALVGELIEAGALEAILFGVLLIGGLSILFYTMRTGVPPMPSNRFARAAMFRLLPKDLSPGVIYELGCGWGGIAFELARRFPSSRVVAVELSPLPWLFCWFRKLVQKRPNLEIRRTDFMKMDLSNGNLLLCYLMVQPMKRLNEKLSRELGNGTVVVTNAFALPDWEAEETEVVPEAMHANIYRYRV